MSTFFKVLLTSEAVIWTREQGWINASRIKGPVKEPEEWTLTSKLSDTKLTLKWELGGYWQDHVTNATESITWKETKPFPFYGRMEKKPMSQPRVAWEEDGAPQGSSSPVEPHKVTVVQPLQMGE
ncbi:hypothetical protein DV515_00017146 [Chloebia gouldiae]|uniref:Uncharacterized protein n=1 Tax=Chloebia gouldiae TaxID=44316 RepID=A0A3L8R111_CHLGU|nr:hypothetical protein DV515_00017143 [Chloebia gouldiae]RLV73211.1 hypothetical protein DV515_00017146 [Chloebia gouldiae]